MPKYLVVSPNGYGNVGDDICAYSGQYLIESLDKANKGVITSPPFKVKQAAASAGVILSGGGPIYDRDEPNVENYMRYFAYAQEHSQFSAALGVGVQGIVTDWGKQRYKEVLNDANLVTTRSEGDKKALDQIGVKKVVATQDLGLLADEWVKAPRIKPRSKHSDKPKLALVLLDVRFLQAYKKGNPKLRKYISIVEDNLDHLANEFDVHLFVHSRDDDDWRAEMAKKHNFKIVPYKTIKDFRKFYYMYTQMDLVVGVRFHSVILGLLAGKPVVGIGSAGTKLFKLAKDAPTLSKQCYPLGDSDKLEDLLENLRSYYDAGEFKVLPDNELSALKNKARLNADLLKKAIG